MSAAITQANLALTIASGDALDVREFSVEEGLSRLFEVRVSAVSPATDVDFEGAIGRPARFEIRHTSSVDGETRHWEGVCADMAQTAVEEDGLSSYAVRIVPVLWLLGQRRNYRVFQDASELDVALAVLAEWGIQPQLRLDRGSYSPRRYRVQYGESDLAFVGRMLEDIGVSYFFDQLGGASVLVLADAPNRAAPRAPLPFVAKPNDGSAREHVTAVASSQEVRPGRYTQSDVDWRRPLDHPLVASVAGGGPIEAQLERHHHDYGAFLWKTTGGGDTPVADDRGAARTSEALGAKQVQRRLQAQRAEARRARFRTTAYDLRPGQVMLIADHPRAELAAPLLVSAARLTGSATGEWAHACESVFTDVDHRPRLETARPRTRGVEAATVTGPAGEEIHTDEFGRVRVHFHWDRQGAADESSSCWIPVSQPWAGAGMGSISLPRVGQEVIVDFLGGDPDRPVVLGSVFTTTTPPPYQLPEHRMVSGLRSETYPRRKPPSSLRMGGGPAGGGLAGAPLGGEHPTDKHNFDREDDRQDALMRSVEKNKATGPDGRDVSRDANAVVFNDRAGAETLYIQAQKQLRILAKRDFTGAVGGARVFTVVGNDREQIGGHQNVQVGNARTVEVGDRQSHAVVGRVEIHTQQSHALRAVEDVKSTAQEGGHLVSSGKLTLLSVGEKTKLLMLPTAIVIESPQVFINPGVEFANALIEGKSLQEAAAAGDQANVVEQARLDAQQKSLTEEGRRLDQAAYDSMTTNPAQFRKDLAAYQAWQQRRAEFETDTGRTLERDPTDF